MWEPRRWWEMRRRRRLAAGWLHGEGLEIGALHEPLPLPAGATARYVDAWDTPTLRTRYPELASRALVEVSVVDDGETLATVGDDSVDFVVANHVIEHVQDPLATLAAWLRVLRSGGTVFMAVPDAARGIDAARPLTTVEHVVADHQDGGAAARSAHYAEYAELVDGVEDPVAHGAAIEALGASIHFHVWTLETFGALLDHAREALELPLERVAAVQNGPEFLVVLRRT